MAGHNQYRSMRALGHKGKGADLNQSVASDGSGITGNKGVMVVFLGATANGEHAADDEGDNYGAAGITFTTLENQVIGIPGLTANNGNLPYLFPVQIRGFESHNADNQIFLIS